MVGYHGKFKIVIYRDGPFGPVFLDTAKGGGFTITIQADDTDEVFQIKGSETVDGQSEIEQTQGGRNTTHSTLKKVA